MSTPDKKIQCTKDCAWFCDDGIPSRCIVTDIAFTLTHLEQKLDNIEDAINESEY